jgi:hypothetical protein
MSDLSGSTQYHAAVAAVLEGGPDDIPDDQRRTTVGEHDEKVKVRHLGGYEHFERTDPTAAGDAVRFHWTMRTRIAE